MQRQKRSKFRSIRTRRAWTTDFVKKESREGENRIRGVGVIILRLFDYTYMAALHCPCEVPGFTCFWDYMHNCMRIYIHGYGAYGLSPRWRRRHKERRCPEEKPIHERRAVAVRVYMRSTRCDSGNKKIKKEAKKRHTGEWRKSIVSAAAARMTINLHRITMHVLIKKKAAWNGKATILHSDIPWPDKTYSANSRGDARQEAERPRPACRAGRRGYIWIFESRNGNGLAPAAE